MTIFTRTPRLVPAVIVVAIALVAPAAQTAAKPIPTCFGQPATIVGSGAIFGTPGDDVIVARRSQT
jgi:hypothetical protein